MTYAHHLRAWLLHRQANQLIKRATAGMHRQSAHQTGGVPRRDAMPAIHRSPWFALAVIVIVYAAGYASADDARIEREHLEQLSALCAQQWPDAPGALEARRRACRVKG